jgi:hypothetical protein
VTRYRDKKINSRMGDAVCAAIISICSKNLNSGTEATDIPLPTQHPENVLQGHRETSRQKTSPSLLLQLWKNEDCEHIQINFSRSRGGGGGRGRFLG